MSSFGYKHRLSISERRIEGSRASDLLEAAASFTILIRIGEFFHSKIDQEMPESPNRLGHLFIEQLNSYLITTSLNSPNKLVDSVPRFQSSFNPPSGIEAATTLLQESYAKALENRLFENRSNVLFVPNLCQYEYRLTTIEHNIFYSQCDQDYQRTLYYFFLELHANCPLPTPLHQELTTHTEKFIEYFAVSSGI